jgi:hippurate hydrolase
MINLIEEAKALQEILEEYRRYLHQIPEIGMELPKTVDFVKSKLIEFGYEPQEICQSGIVALAGGKKPGKTFLLRADMDALPIKEDTDLPFKSQSEYMHACGHDFHTSMLLGAAYLLKKHENEINGTVKLMFQPGEEIMAGAKMMVESGVLENPKVDAAGMIHVRPGVGLLPGTAIVTEALEGAAALDWFTINIQGKGGHGAMPETTVDPINVASHIHTALQEINSREVHPSEFVVLTIGYMQGGSAANVIPDKAIMSGTIRSYKKEVRELVKRRLVQISEAIAVAFRAKAEVVYSTQCPSVYNDPQLISQINDYLFKLMGEERFFNASKNPALRLERMSGSEDFSFVSEKVPSILLRLATGRSEDGYNYPQHHPKALFDEEALQYGAAIYAGVAMEWLNNQQA